MKIIFFGSSKFAVPALKEIRAAGHDIVCVVTQPDKKSGRGMKDSCTPVKQAALKSGLEVHQPADIRSNKEALFLKGFDADLFVVIAYGNILKPDILGIPKIFSVNLHASLLPRYRGAAPINWAIINGEKKTGVSIICMNEKMDQGQIISQEETMISDTDTESSLEEKLALSGANLLVKTLPAIEQKSCLLIAQDDKKATLAPKLKKNDGLIDWSKTASQIRDLIRGTELWPGAFTYFKGKTLKVHSAQIVEGGPLDAPGTVIAVTNEGILMAAGKDKLLIKELQIEGKRKMTTKDFICGHKIKTGDTLGKKGGT